MKLARIILPTFFALSGCSAEAQLPHSSLSAEIERKVQLPKGAPPADEYVRFYAFAEGDKVMGRWLIPSPAKELRPDEGCAEVVMVGPETTLREVPCPPDQPWPPEGRAGEIRWIDRAEDLPGMAHGGCMQITIIFDLRSRKIEDVWCNHGS